MTDYVQKINLNKTELNGLKFIKGSNEMHQVYFNGGQYLEKLEDFYFYFQLENNTLTIVADGDDLEMVYSLHPESVMYEVYNFILSTPVNSYILSSDKKNNDVMISY